MNREKLIAAGIDYDEGVDRFGGQPSIYDKYLKKFFNDPLMDVLRQQLKDNDIPGAFTTAHSIKGVAGNLSINSYYKIMCELTELLRGWTGEGDYMPLLSQAEELYAKARRAATEEQA